MSLYYAIINRLVGLGNAAPRGADMRRGGMHPDDLRKPDLLSEILLLASGMLMLLALALAFATRMLT